MSNRPLVSIVLPTYNGAPHLRESIQSCVDQSFTDWELIIVDDASTDDTPRITSEYAVRDGRIRIIRNEVNRKLPASLNLGFLQSKGELLTWTSDDNWYQSSALGRMVASLVESHQVDIVYANMQCVSDDGRPLVKYPCDTIDTLPFRNCIGACFLFRRTVFEQIGGYDETLFLAEDYDFWLRASNRFKFNLIPDILYFYRLNGDLSKRRAAVLEATDKTLERWLPTTTWLSKETKGLAYAALANLAFERGAFGRGRKHYWRAMITARRPLLIPGCRSRIVDFLFGARTGDIVRSLICALRST